MDKLAKNKAIREKLDAKLKAQRREIADLKRQNKNLDHKLWKLGGIRVEDDCSGDVKTIAVQVRVDNRMARLYPEVWMDAVCKIAAELGYSIAHERTLSIFNECVQHPDKLRDWKMRWIFDMMHDRAFRTLDSHDLMQAWESAFNAIIDYAKRNKLEKDF
jgi:hypothetical protein